MPGSGTSQARPMFFSPRERTKLFALFVHPDAQLDFGFSVQLKSADIEPQKVQHVRHQAGEASLSFARSPGKFRGFHPPARIGDRIAEKLGQQIDRIGGCAGFVADSGEKAASERGGFIGKTLMVTHFLPKHLEHADIHECHDCPGNSSGAVADGGGVAQYRHRVVFAQAQVHFHRRGYFAAQCPQRRRIVPGGFLPLGRTESFWAS